MGPRVTSGGRMPRATKTRCKHPLLKEKKKKAGLFQNSASDTRLQGMRNGRHFPRRLPLLLLTLLVTHSLARGRQIRLSSPEAGGRRNWPHFEVIPLSVLANRKHSSDFGRTGTFLCQQKRGKQSACPKLGRPLRMLNLRIINGP